MSEPAAEHPGYAWLMNNLDALERRYPEQWAISDGQGLAAHGPNLSELLQWIEAKGRALPEFCVCYLALVVGVPDDDDGGGRRATSPLTGGPGGLEFDPWDARVVLPVPVRG